jgi:hypothetical protein
MRRMSLDGWMERKHERNGARSSAVKEEEGRRRREEEGMGGRNKEGIVPRKYLYSQGTGGTSRSISGV